MGVFPRVKAQDELATFLMKEEEVQQGGHDNPLFIRPSTDLSSRSSHDNDNSRSISTLSNHDLPLLHVVGRVCSRRALGRAMLFWDLVSPIIPKGQGGDEVLRLECLLHRQGLAGLTAAHVRQVMHLIHVGDVLRIEGYLDDTRGHYVLEAKAFAVMESWRATHAPREVSER